MYRERLKLLHACVYFSNECWHVGRMKLYKLLYLLDFQAFRRRGRSVTGLEYFAWKMGPVPKYFHQEWVRGFESDFASALVATSKNIQFNYDDDWQDGYDIEKLEPKIEFNEALFSDPEFGELASLATKYFRTTAKEMSLESHVAFGYWDEVWNFRDQKDGIISYELVFDRQNTEKDQLMREYSMLRKQIASHSE